MTKIELTLALPDRLAREAKEAGLLSGRAVARLVRDELRRRAPAGKRRPGQRQKSLVELLAGDPDIDFEPELLGSLGQSGS